MSLAEYTLRPILPSDLESVHRLNRRIEEADGIPIATPLEEFQEWLDDPHLDMATDCRLVEVDAAIVAWGRIWYQPSGVREERSFVFGGVDPEFRRRGIGSRMLAWEIERATELLLRAPSELPRFVRTQAYDFQDSSARLFERHRMRPVRYSNEMVRPLDDSPVPRLVPGITIAPWNPARNEDARHAHNAGFADHWGSTPRDAAGWQHDLESFGTRLDLSFLAMDQDQIVGVCRNGHFPADEPITGRRDGWIIQVSVIPTHRKRGIASALIAASLATFKAQDFTHAALGVDSQNPTGALRLYERLGYRAIHRSVVYERQVHPPGSSKDE